VRQLRKSSRGPSRPIITSRRDTCSCSLGTRSIDTYFVCGCCYLPRMEFAFQKTWRPPVAVLSLYGFTAVALRFLMRILHLVSEKCAMQHSRHRGIAIWHHDGFVSCCPNCLSVACFCIPLTALQHSIVPKTHHGGFLTLLFNSSLAKFYVIVFMATSSGSSMLDLFGRKAPHSPDSFLFCGF